MSLTNDRAQVLPPTRFVGTHGHSHFSTGDGLGTPQEHIEFVLENGGDAWSLTDHGNANGYCHGHSKAKELKKKGRDFKFVCGVEAYYHPDLSEWREEHARAKLERDAAKKQKKTHDDADDVGSTVENEEESKNVSKWFDPVRRRHHLVLLPTTTRGLENIFALISRSYKEGFYKFPRIDRKMLKEHGQDVIVTSACLHPESMLMTQHGPLKIIDVIAKLHSGDDVLVLSWNETTKKACYSKVTWGDCTRQAAKLYQITLVNGEKLKLTGDHKVFTQRGWVEVQTLTKHDQILSIHQ